MPDQQQNSERDFTHVLFTQLEMQQHFCAKPFRQSLGLARMLFDSYDEITKLKAEQEELRAQVSVLQREVRSTKLAELAFERLLALAIVGVAGRIGDWLISGMAKVFGHLGFERPLHQFLGELLEQPILPNQVIGFLVISQ